MQSAALFCLLTTAVATSLQVNFPLNLQMPPVARVGEEYNFQLSATTFQPNPDQLVYSIAGGPSWLHIHSENRTLWGTPEAEDAGTATFTVVAAGEAGAVANMESQLPVEKDSGPKVNGNISQTLSKAGQLSGPQSVTVLPSKSFEINFRQDVFQADGKKLSYHATLADHTPLPAWISFDAQALRFVGIAPSSASPRTFDILLMASDTPGYTVASISFSLIVSNHLLLFKPLIQTVNLSKGEHVDITGLKGMVFLDNATIHDDDIQSASANIPKWLSFDSHSFNISGNPPSGLMSQDLSISVQDKYGDLAEHSIHLMFISQLFTGEVGSFNITPGVYFEHPIQRSILTLEDETISVDFGELNKWLSFDPESMVISGIVPDDTTAGSVEGSMTATSSDGKTKDTQTFEVVVVGDNTPNHSDPLVPDTNGKKPGADKGQAKSGTGGSSPKKTGIIVGAVLSSVFAAAIFVILFMSLCRRRKKQQKGYISPNTPRSPCKTDISRPIPIASGIGEIDRAEYEDLEKGKLSDSSPQAAERPALLQLQIPATKRAGHSHSTSLNERDDNLITQLHKSLSFQVEKEPIHHPHDSMKIPTDMARKKSADPASQQRRNTTSVSKDSTHRKSGVLGNRRSTAPNPRQHAHSTSHGTNCSAAQRTLSTSSHTTALSTVPSAYPQPSKARHVTHFTTPLEKRQSIRPVVPSPCESPERVERLLDRRTIDEKRHSYIRKRSSAQQSPLFAGSRVLSTSYKSAPGFIGDSTSAPKSSPLRPIPPNIVKPSDTVLSSDNDLPESLRIRKPTDTPSPTTTKFDLTKSLRKNRPTRGFVRRHTDGPLTKGSDSDEVKTSPSRPGTAVYAPTGMGSRTSTQASLRGPKMRESFNKVLGEEVFIDRELSESNYSTEEEDIEDAERRNTLKPSNSVRNWIGPLKIEKSDEKSEHESKRGSKRNGRRNSKALKRTSEHEHTPFYRPRALEHGGKENVDSSLYNLAADDSIKATATAAVRPKRTSTSPSIHPNTAIGQRPKIPSPNFSRTLTRSPSEHTSTYPLPRIPSSPKERHSRKSIHSRSQSRRSSSRNIRKPRDRSRTQSASYPRFAEASSLLHEINKAAERTSTITPTRPRKNTSETIATERDDAGNVIGYGEDEMPRIEELRRESIGIGIGMGGGSGSGTGASKVVQGHIPTSPFYHSKRDTAAPSSAPTTPGPSAGVGLGLSLLEGGLAAEDTTPGPESTKKGEYKRERTPLEVLDDGNGGIPERPRVVEGKGKRPVSVEVDEEMQKKKKGFGSLKGALRRGSSIWKSRESKAFL